MSHYLQYIREELLMATSDDPARTKGQLEAMTDRIPTNTQRYRRKLRTFEDAETGKRLAIHTDPVPGAETRPNSRPRPLIEPLAYMKSSWRRAFLEMQTPEREWLLWAYTCELTFAQQVAITKHLWAEFQRIHRNTELQEKTLERVRRLVWLSAQDVKNGLMGKDIYTGTRLAQLVGTTPRNWNKTLKTHWDTLRLLCLELDANALLNISRTRMKKKREERL